jgi:hypothetical protein
VLTKEKIYFFKEKGFAIPTEAVDLSQCRASMQVVRRDRAHCFHLQATLADGARKDVVVSVDSDEEVRSWLGHTGNHVEIVKTGWMMKQRRYMSSFHDRRWCVLTKSQLYFFEEQTLDFREPAEVVKLANIQACVPHSTEAHSLLIHQSLEVNFMLTQTSPALQNSDSCASEVEEWLECFWSLGVAQEIAESAPSILQRRNSMRSDSGALNQTTENPASKHEHAPAFSLCMVLVFLVYIVSPVDLLPDVIPFIGWLDDAVAGVLMLFFARPLLRGRTSTGC